MYLLDTNVTRDIKKPGGNKNVQRWWKQVDAHEVYVSVFVIMESIFGIEEKRRDGEHDVADELESRLNDIIAALEPDNIVDFDLLAARVAGALEVYNKNKLADICMAATARARNLVVVTKNVRDFKGSGARVLDPSKGSPRAVVA